MRRFTRDSDGRLVVALHVAEVQLLRALAASVGEALRAPRGEDPVTTRLFPRAYTDPTEEVAEQEWEAMVRGDLVRERLGALTDLSDRLDRATPKRDVVRIALDADGEAHLLGAVNDMRLALGAVLGVTADHDSEARPAGDAWELYDWLTGFEAAFVEVLLDGMPE